MSEGGGGQWAAPTLAALATGSSIVINLATDLKTDLWPWAGVAVLLAVTVWLTWRQQRPWAVESASPAEARASRTVSSRTTGVLKHSATQVELEAHGLHLEIIEERLSGERIYMRAYSLEAAEILARDRHNTVGEGGGQNG